MDLPNMQRWLERLPGGIDAHPQCMVKSAPFRDAVESKPLDGVIEQLPAPVAELVRYPPPVSAWIPETHALCALIATLDAHFSSDPAGREAYEQWVYDRNRRLLLKPLYRALFLLLTPDRLLRGMESRWAAFRKGTNLVLLEHEGSHAKARVEFPYHLYDDTVILGMTAAFRAAVEAAGARHTQIRCLSLTSVSADVEMNWR